MLFKEIVDKGHYAFYDSAENWEEAIRKSCIPLEKTGCVTSSYADSIIADIKELGPYIVIIPNLAIPHSTKKAEEIMQTAVSFTKFEKAVAFDPNNPNSKATIFMTLCAKNQQSHLQNMKQIFRIFTDNKALKALFECKTEKDLERLDLFLREDSQKYI